MLGGVSGVASFITIYKQQTEAAIFSIQVMLLLDFPPGTWTKHDHQIHLNINLSE